MSFNMEKQNQTRAHRSVMFFGILMASIYAMCVTIFMVFLYRLTVEQSTRIRTLETITGELTTRVNMLQNSFTAQSVNKDPVGETNGVFAETSFRPKSKGFSSEGELRNKRQLEGFCPCLQGPRGRRGKRGHKGDQGPKGDPGPTGPTGPQGPRGRNGSRGDTGMKGKPGPSGAQGLKGEKGDIGPKGADGQPGPQGPTGPLIAESIHLVGDGRRIRMKSSHRITGWKEKHRNGSIVYHKANGRVQIKRKGYYFIYSQMYYYDGSAVLMSHQTYINHDQVMESVGSIVSERNKYNTKYHGGVFLMEVNDTISVGIPYTKVYYMDEEASFFGAFLLYPM